MPSILIIDDDDSLRDSLRRTLHKEGYTIMVAAEGGEGIKIIQNHPIDVALVDLFMPGKEGLETILELRRSHPTVKIIAMSGGGANGQVDMLQAAKVMGRCQALVKPFSREDLIAAIESLLSGTSHSADAKV